MTSLLDIAPLSESVPVGGGQSVEVFGVTAEGFASLWARFPEVQKIFARKVGEINPENLVSFVPACLAAVIAAGSGFPGNPKAERKAATLNIDAQVALIAAILRLTMPEGAGPFVERLTALGLLSLTTAAPTTEPHGKA